MSQKPWDPAALEDSRAHLTIAGSSSSCCQISAGSLWKWYNCKEKDSESGWAHLGVSAALQAAARDCQKEHLCLEPLLDVQQTVPWGQTLLPSAFSPLSHPRVSHSWLMREGTEGGIFIFFHWRGSITISRELAVLEIVLAESSNRGVWLLPSFPVQDRGTVAHRCRRGTSWVFLQHHSHSRSSWDRRSENCRHEWGSLKDSPSPGGCYPQVWVLIPTLGADIGWRSCHL